MIYNLKKVDAQMFKTQMDSFGRDIVSFYTKETDRILVEPNSSYDGGKIYCRKDSWVNRGDIISISDNWYLISNLSNLASDVYNVGTITLCDVTLTVELGDFTYEVPSVASKYSGSSNVRGIIDDSVEGKLSFITGYHKEFDDIVGNPYVVLFGKVWQIGDTMNVNNVMNVYCQGAEQLPQPKIGMSKVETKCKLGDRFKVKMYWLNTTETEPITYSVNMGIATIDQSGNVHCTGRGTFNIVGTGTVSGKMYISPDITVK